MVASLKFRVLMFIGPRSQDS